MSWKEDLTQIVEDNERIRKLLIVLQSQVVMGTKKIEAMRVLLDDQIKNQSRAADRMADRMIEMAMVNQGGAREAAGHRRSLDEKPTEGVDLWQDDPNTQWPPVGCDELRMP